MVCHECRQVLQYPHASSPGPCRLCRCICRMTA
ncbi:MAG: hypothetical protein E2O37_08140 [Proteobacteria bacterium]|nr:MAG: hypothetical protein E2O37_08140 [Pseudomonadota bacterium]TDJ72233.1 MAG: hypothetical protein E2O38_05245 [Pseudomonadota bacterium]